MIIYLAATMHRESQDLGFLDANGLENFLEKKKLLKYFKKKRKKIFLDSGAFSAYTRGKEVNLDEYIEFIKEYKNKIGTYVNLDVIGSPEGTWKNQRYMEKKGLMPLPVWHPPFEDLDILQKYVDAGYDYIGFGGLAKNEVPERITIGRLDKAFRITQEKGIRIHGFGMTSQELMKKYPWFSVDSTTWTIASAMGTIIMDKKTFPECYSPWFRNIPTRLIVSERREHEKTYIKKLPLKVQKVIKKRLQDWGQQYFDDPERYPFEELRVNYYMRCEFNTIFFLEFERLWKWEPTTYRSFV